MSRLGKTNEKRAEPRLRYRWPVRFAMKMGQKPLRGQIVDVTSRGLAFLCHPGQNCPNPDQLVTAGFGVPHFNSHGSFDTVFFNRVGRVCRVDSLNDKVSRVAIQFAEPLFFQPGEQSISETDAQQRLEAHARSLVEARRTNGANKQTPVKAARSPAAKRKSPAPAGKQGSSEKRGRREVQAQSEQIAKLSTETANVIAGITAEAGVRALAQVANRIAAGKKKNAKCSTALPADGGLLKKVDSFITDKSKVF